VWSVFRFARLQVFETNIMKYIVDWNNIKMLEVRLLLARSFLYLPYTA